MSSGDAPAHGHLVLLVAGGAPRSRRARGNLDDALRDAQRAELAVEEIDVFEQPRVALRYGVFATPALVHDRDGTAAAVLYGDLSDRPALERFLAAEVGAEVRAD